MTRLTITEALAELKTLGKRIEKKQEFVKGQIGRPAVIRDPMEQEGGIAAKVASERQSIGDLSERIIRIRVAIQAMNQATTVTILQRSRTIAEWLTWRKEIAPREQSLLSNIRQTIKATRAEAVKHSAAVVQAGTNNLYDVILHVDESQLSKEIDDLENTLGTLDGQLSLVNATTFIDITD